MNSGLIFHDTGEDQQINAWSETIHFAADEHLLKRRRTKNSARVILKNVLTSLFVKNSQIFEKRSI